VTTDPGNCMQLLPNARRPWCDLPADPQSATGTPRCTGHLTPDTIRKESAK
jgi:hypothetical protein